MCTDKIGSQVSKGYIIDHNATFTSSMIDVLQCSNKIGSQVSKGYIIEHHATFTSSMIDVCQQDRVTSQ
jgi:hypothetical protein